MSASHPNWAHVDATIDAATERQRAAWRAANHRRRTGQSRYRQLTPERDREIAARYTAGGVSLRQIAADLGIGLATVCRALSRSGIPRRNPGRPRQQPQDAPNEP